MQSFIGQKVKVYSSTGTHRKGIVTDVNERNLMLEAQEEGDTKTILFNKRNIFMIEQA